MFWFRILSSFAVQTWPTFVVKCRLNQGCGLFGGPQLFLKDWYLHALFFKNSLHNRNFCRLQSFIRFDFFSMSKGWERVSCVFNYVCGLLCVVLMQHTVFRANWITVGKEPDDKLFNWREYWIPAAVLIKLKCFAIAKNAYCVMETAE